MVLSQLGIVGVLASEWFPVAERAFSFMTVDAKGRATLPEEVRRALGLEGGDFLLLEKTERGTFELVPATLIPRDQLWFHHPEMQARIAKAEADRREGRIVTTETLEEAQALLDSLKAAPRTRARRSG
ncbi:AbrB/MazE/SpoVT family DNA-binding domain-containing protein [Longimicrobium sp.]|uniref:AbrB/MazE/SpoVT family DNA-binding domain-containing protein n=1 Tax=Longimicrobium sp. TaxID=2029185 RepID=UPI002E350CFF|nr:AbrB/MazE/SpoVT family DNA-binding domain-containing protein [Longimicrobium sp.]